MNRSTLVNSLPSNGFAILAAASIAHLLNDAMQTAVPSSFPLLHEKLGLSFAQIGWIAFALNVTASVLQPAIGFATDRKFRPWLMPLGMLFSLSGMLLFGLGHRPLQLLLAAVLVGIGSSVFHPESSRVAYGSLPDRKGLAQSIFQVGGNTGQALAPLAVALLVVPFGQLGLLSFALLAVCGFFVQLAVSTNTRLHANRSSAGNSGSPAPYMHTAGYRVYLLAIFIVLLFSKFVYLSSMTGYYAFYAIQRFGGTCSFCSLPEWRVRWQEGHWRIDSGASGSSGFRFLERRRSRCCFLTQAPQAQPYCSLSSG